ncbi:MAG: zinc-binding alcohol dehydrogenase family protein, partial [Jatrophihabitantaceae bacterium]
TWAEHAVVPRQALVPVPAGLDLRLAAPAGVVGSTAVRVTCDLGEVGPADRALVLGAGGGTGVAISSLARSRGALVWGQVGDPAKVEAVRQSGAEPILAGSAAQLHEQIAELGITVAFDPLGGAYTAALVAALVPRGRLISYGVSAGEQVTLSMRTIYRNNLTVRGFGGVAEPAERLSASIRLALQHLAAGSMRIPVDRVLPLAAADRALAALANREVAGKALLDTRA